MKKIRFELSTKPSKQEKAAQGKSGFVPATLPLALSAQCLDAVNFVKNHREVPAKCNHETQSWLLLGSMLKRLAALWDVKWFYSRSYLMSLIWSLAPPVILVCSSQAFPLKKGDGRDLKVERLNTNLSGLAFVSYPLKFQNLSGERILRSFKGLENIFDIQRCSTLALC